MIPMRPSRQDADRAAPNPAAGIGRQIQKPVRQRILQGVREIDERRRASVRTRMVKRKPHKRAVLDTNCGLGGGLRDYMAVGLDKPSPNGRRWSGRRRSALVGRLEEAFAESESGVSTANRSHDRGR